MGRLAAIFSDVSPRCYQIESGRMQFDARVLHQAQATVCIASSNVGLAIDAAWSDQRLGVALAAGPQRPVQVYGRRLDADTAAVGIGASELHLLLPAAHPVYGCHSTFGEVSAAAELIGLPDPAALRPGLQIQQFSDARCAVLRRHIEATLADLPAVTALLADNPRELAERSARALATFLSDRDSSSRPVAIASARRRAVRRITEAVSANSRRRYTLSDLCGIACVSPRTLEYAFYDNFRLSPLAYVRALRLQGARHALLRHGDGAGVSAIALEYGFTHLGKFSVDYRRMFGERPSETLRYTGWRLRGTSTSRQIQQLSTG